MSMDQNMPDLHQESIPVNFMYVGKVMPATKRGFKLFCFFLSRETNISVCQMANVGDRHA